MERIGRMTWMMTLIGALAFALPELARAQDPDEPEMTWEEYDSITETESSVEGEAEASIPLAIHKLTDDEEKALREGGAERIIKAKEWRNLNPKERDARLRQERLLHPDAIFIMTVPQGQVWAMPKGMGVDWTHDHRFFRWWHRREVDLLPPHRTRSNEKATHREKEPPKEPEKVD
jgi:hypothetical protein